MIRWNMIRNLRRRLLFSSDLHALRPAFELFARTLAEGPYDAGSLAGNLLDDLLLPEDFLVHERRPRWHLFGHVHSGCGRRGRYLNGCYPHSMEFFDIDDGKRRVARIAAQVAVPDPRWS